MPKPTPVTPLTEVEGVVAPVFPGPLASPERLEEFDNLYARFLGLIGGGSPLSAEQTLTEIGDPLKPGQRRRVVALKEARDLLAARSFVGSIAPNAVDLTMVADYILEG